MEITYTPIGIAHSQYKHKHGMPRQPEANAVNRPVDIVFFEHCNYEQALEDIEGFDRIWIIFHFHCNSGWKPKTLTPRSRTKHGVFSTRSPYRPNSIGISCVRLLQRKGRTLTVADCDVLDGTPILDVKPYIPAIDSFPDSKAGWTDALPAVPPYSVILSERVEKFLSPHYDKLREQIHEVLGLDPFPHPYRRIQQKDNGSYCYSIRFFRIYYTVENNCAYVDNIVETAKDNHS